MSMQLTMNKKNIFHWIAMILIMAVFYVIPAVGPVTPYGMKILGVFVGLIYGWTFIGMLAPSLAGVIALACAGYGSGEQVFLALFANSSILMMIIGSLGFDAIRQTNVSDWFFGKILTSKLAKKSSLLTIGCIFTAVLILGGLGMGILLQFVLLPIFNEFLKKCGYEKGDRFSTLFLMGYLIAAVMPIGIFPFYSWGLMICGSFSSISTYEIPLGPYMIANIIIYIIFLATWPLLMKVAKCDFSKLENVDVAEAFNFEKDVKLNIGQKITLGGLILFILLVVLCSFFPIPGLSSIYSSLTVCGLMVIYWIVVMFVQVDNKPLLDMREASSMMNWDLCILMAVALVLSSALTSEESGIGAAIAMVIGPIVANVSGIALIMILAAILIILTNLANNIAVVFILINVVSSLYLNGVEMNMLAVSIILAMGSCAVAYFIPASSLPGALLHGANMTESKSIYFWNWIAAIYLFVIMMIVLIPISLLGIGM